MYDLGGDYHRLVGDEFGRKTRALGGKPLGVVEMN